MSTGVFHYLAPLLFLGGAALGWLLAGGTEDGEPAPGVPSGKAAPRPETGWDQSHLPSEARALIAQVWGAAPGEERLRAVISLANRIPVDQIERWLDDHYFVAADRQLAAVFEEILHRRLLEADPERCLDRCLRKENGWVHSYLVLWTRSDPVAAENYLLSLTQRRHLWLLSERLLGEIVKERPGRTLELLGQWAPYHLTSSGWGRRVFESLARDHPDLLAEHLSALPSTLRSRATQALAGGRLARDFRAGLEWIETLPDGARVLGEAIERNGKLALGLREHLAELPEGWLETIGGRWAGALTENDPQWWREADLQALGFSDEVVQTLRTKALGSMAQKPEFAEEARKIIAAGTGLNEAEQMRLVWSSIYRWSKDDRAGAEAWLATVENPDLRADVANYLARRDRAAPRSTPAQLMQRAGGGSVDREAIGLEAMKFWVASDLAEARNAFRALPEAERDRAAEFVLQRRGDGEVPPALAAEALSHRLAHPPDGAEQRSEMMRDLCEATAQWGKSNPRAAAQWVERLPRGEAFEWAARNLVSSWAAHAPGEARRWVESLPESIDRGPLRELLER